MDDGHTFVGVIEILTGPLVPWLSPIRSNDLGSLFFLGHHFRNGIGYTISTPQYMG
jgi:hypothetical protein